MSATVGARLGIQVGTILGSIVIALGGLIHLASTARLGDSAGAGEAFMPAIIVRGTAGIFGNAVGGKRGAIIGGIVHGLCFGVALSLVFMAGGDLFTSNAMIMTIGALEKKVTWLDAVKIWIAVWIGNIMGGVIGAFLYVYSGAASGILALCFV